MGISIYCILITHSVQ